MIWLILPFIILGLIAGRRRNEDGCGYCCLIGLGVLLVVGCLVVTGYFMKEGYYVYPKLEASRAEVLSLKEEIETVRNAYYKDLSKNYIIGGLENFKQSTALSEYIKLYATKKAKYNSELRFAKVKKQSLFFILFCDGLYISEKVLELEEIK